MGLRVNGKKIVSLNCCSLVTVMRKWEKEEKLWSQDLDYLLSHTFLFPVYIYIMQGREQRL